MEIRYYCTYFDRNYLFRGLTLYRSMERHCGEFLLYILCMDEITYDLLNKLKLEKAYLIKLGDFEDSELLAVKNKRTQVEYCWTCTPSLPLYLLKKYHHDLITYLDADLIFFSSPEKIFNEFGNNSILITEHRFSKDIEENIREKGKYNVQFLTFRNNENSLKCLHWWREQCLNWCYNRHENGLIGDQAYLNDWTVRFKGVYELKNIGAGLAPWNIFNYKITKRGGIIFVNDEQLIFYHYHAFKIYSINLFQYVVGYMSKLKRNEKEIIYDEYIYYIKSVIREVAKADISFNHGFSKKSMKDLFIIFISRIKLFLNI